MKRKIIYDLGSNNGDDIPYYLLKSDLVVAVEANPSLCEIIRHRFAEEITACRVEVVNCVLAPNQASGLVDFFIHKREHVLSQLGEPALEQMDKFRKERLPARSVGDIISEHGDPYYIKIDIESCDASILRSLFQAGCFPPFISAEAHSFEVFSLLHAVGGYNAFKLVDGHTVSAIYRNRQITKHSSLEKVTYSFPYNSAGPFGNDVEGPWWSGDDFARILSFEIMGWKDIHATHLEPDNLNARVRFRNLILKYLCRAIPSKIMQTKKIGVKILSKPI